MASDAEYKTLRWDEYAIKPNRAEAAASAMRADAKTSGNGQALGVFVPWIGMSINTVTVATMWIEEPRPTPVPWKSDVMRGKSRVFDILARGQQPCPIDRPGIYTHRWFVVRPEHVDLMTETSVEAWKGMEADTPARVSGFWLSRERDAEGNATILMLVFYPDLTAWEQSRFWKPLPPGIDQPNRAEWGERFRKRREITIDSSVTIHRLVG